MQQNVLVLDDIQSRTISCIVRRDCAGQERPCRPGETVPARRDRAGQERPCRPGETVPARRDRAGQERPCRPGETVPARRDRAGQERPCRPGETVLGQESRYRNFGIFSLFINLQGQVLPTKKTFSLYRATEQQKYFTMNYNTKY